MKIVAVLMLFATMSFLHAQDQPKPPVDPGSRVFELKYVSPSQMARLLGYSGRQFDDQLKVLVLHGNKNEMDQAEQFIRRFDVPLQNVEVTIYIMSALGQPATALVPAELEGVVKQLKGMFSYKAYQLVDTQVIRTRAGQGGESSGIVDNGSQIKTISQAKFRAASISKDEKGIAIRIDGLKVGLKVPVPASTSGQRARAVATGGPNPPEISYVDTGINTDVDVHEGQKVVVGKANMDGSDRASIVVLTAKVVE